VPSLVIVLSAVLVFFREDKQTNKHRTRDGAKRLTPVTTVSVSKYVSHGTCIFNFFAHLYTSTDL